MVPVTFIVLLLLGVPIALVLALTAMVYIGVSGNHVLFLSYPQQFFGGLEKYGLLAVPLFMLVGELMHEGGITRRLVALASVFIGRLKGGLAYINIMANMFLASIVGSAAAQIAVMARTMVPAMEAKGYERSFATATTAAGALLAPVIPPSMLFVLYGVLAQISIGDMFVAGIVPGLIMAVGFIIAIAVLGTWYEMPRGERLDLRQKWINVRNSIPALMVPVVIIGGILTGLTTPTEAAALGVAAALAVGTLGYREIRFRRMLPMMVRVAINSTVVLILIAAATVFGWVIVFEQIPQQLAALIQEITQSPFLFMLLVMLSLLLIGTVIDGIAALIIIVPILLPIAQNVYGIDPFHFGVVVVLNLVLGFMTPPIGLCLYVGAAVTGVKPSRLFRVTLPFFAVTVVILILLSIFPVLSTVLSR